MGYSIVAANQALDSLAGGTINVLAYVTLFSADPGTVGTANEYTTTRQACSWNAASARSKTNSTALTIPTGGATACTYFGTFSAATGTTNFGIGGALSSSVTAASITIAAGALTLSA